MNTPNPTTFSRRHFLSTATTVIGGSLIAGSSLGRAFAAQSSITPAMADGQFVLPKLPYAVNELIPYIDAKTMVIHHGKHHAGYTKKLNAAIAKAPGLAGQDINALLANLPATDESVRTALRNNGGGYYNHCLFWETMSPKKTEPSVDLAKAIDRDLGGMDEFKAAFAQAAKTRFGSGWAWLTTDKNGKLSISSTANQDNPLMTGIVEAAGTPILGLDVWEHAYYLHYQNRRADYIKAWFNLINWEKVSALYAAVTASA